MGRNSFADRVNEKAGLERRLIDRTRKNIYNSAMHSEGRKTSDYCTGTISGGLCALMDYYGIDVDMPENMGGEEELRWVIAETGIMTRNVKLFGKWWKDVTLPLLVYDNRRKMNVVLIPDGRKYIYYDESGKHVMKQSAAADINEDAQCFYRPLANDVISIRRFCIELLKAFSVSDIICLLFISFVVSILGLITPMINKYIFNNIVPSGTSAELSGIGILFVGTAVVSVVITVLRSIWIMRVGAKIEIFGQNAVYARLLELPAEFFKKYDSGELTMRVEAINKVCKILGGELISSTLGALFAFVYLFQIAGIAPQLLPASIAVIILMIIYMLADIYLQLKYMEKCNEADGRLSGFAYQIFSGITKVKTAGAEIRVFAKWAELYEKYPLMPGLFTRIAGRADTYIRYAGLIVIYYIVTSRNVSPSEFIAYNASFGGFCGAVMMLSGITRQIAMLKPSLDLLRPVIEEKPENEGHKPRVDKLSGNIELNQVYFRYCDDMPYVLDGLNLTVRSGEYLGIAGSSGCGKSTLLRILLGFEKPESGSVYYDLQDLSGLDMRSVRRRIGVVLQNGRLFSGDIFSNIAAGTPWLSVEEAWDAARACGLAEDIESFPMGMSTLISDGGGGLSGGQQQRLLIARALASKPDMIMFDEATSALDNITQAQIVKTLEELDCTRIVIAHRLSTIKNCSRIIYLDKGRVVEEGTYDELMELNGRFAAMARRQIV